MMRFLLLFLLLFICSCMPQKKLPPPSSYVTKQKPKKEETSILITKIISASEIDNDLKLLKDILKNPDLSEKEKNEINSLLNNLSLVKKLISKGKVSLDDTKKILRLLYSSFSLLEKKYAFLLYKKVDISKVVKEIADKRRKIIEAYQQGKYTDVVNECLELKLKFGADIIDPEIETIFALSLGEIGMFREAVETGEKAFKQISAFPEREILKSKLEEWKNIVKEAEAKKEVTKEKKEEVNIDLVITNVERLIRQENFEQALAILNAVKVENKKIDQLKNQAIEGIINRERNKAAKLFLLAKETKQIEEKRKYLEEAYRILEALILQYPDSPLIKRVKENLDRVEEEIKNLDMLKGGLP